MEKYWPCSSLHPRLLQFTGRVHEDFWHVFGLSSHFSSAACHVCFVSGKRLKLDQLRYALVAGVPCDWALAQEMSRSLAGGILLLSTGTLVVQAAWFWVDMKSRGGPRLMTSSLDIAHCRRQHSIVRLYVPKPSRVETFNELGMYCIRSLR